MTFVLGIGMGSDCYFISNHKCLHQVRDLQKKMQHVENDLDITIEKLSSTTTKLDEKDKSFQLAEGEIQAWHFRFSRPF